MLERTAAPAPATVNTARPTPGGGAGPATIATTGLMLFALFFGAGNLVFPPVLGASAGAHLPAVLVGFLATGVVAPLAAVVAVSTSGEGIVGLARRVGPRFGALMPLAVYLSIGPLYAVPRVATVSYELAIRPLLGLAGVDAGHWALPAHAAVFFTASVAVAARPSHLADAIGRWLTPALLALIAVLCTVVVASQPVVTRPAAPDYTAAPVATGLTRGYLTMDVLAATVFGIVVITTLHGRGLRTPRAVVRATAASGALAAGLLAAVYVGLALIGERTPGAADDGTALLRAAAARALGDWGVVIFAAIVLLACLTTSVGLLSAWAGYATAVLPALPVPARLRPHAQLLAGAVISFGLANLGLRAMIAVITPVTLLLYPVAITLVLVALIDAVAPGHLRAAYRVPVGVAGLLGLVAALAGFGVDAPAQLLAATGHWNDTTGWILPTLVAGALGIAADLRSGRWGRTASGH